MLVGAANDEEQCQHAKNKKRLTKLVRPPSQRGKKKREENRMEGKKLITTLRRLLSKVKEVLLCIHFLEFQRHCIFF